MNKAHHIVLVAAALSLITAPNALQASFSPRPLRPVTLHGPPGRDPASAEKPLLASENSPSDTGQLHVAAAAGNVEQVKRLISENPDRINEKDSHGLTPLHEAARKGHAGVVEVLITAGADPNDITTDGNQTPLHLAATVCSEDVLRTLLEAGARFNVYNEDSKVSGTAIRVAIQEGRTEDIKCLADIFADINWHQRQSENEEYLYVNLNDNLLSNNSLSIAASNGHIEIVKILIEHGKTVLEEYNKMGSLRMAYSYARMLDYRDFNGNSALHAAAYNGYTEIARLLRQAGAYSMVENDNHKTPIDLAYEQGHKSLAQMLEQVPELLKASASGDVRTVKQLIDEEQSINVRHPRDGYTPLHQAAQEGSAEVVKLLIDAGANIYLRRNKGYSGNNAFDIAIEEGHTEVVKLFADTILPIVPSYLFDAASNGHTEIMKILIEAASNKYDQDHRFYLPTILNSIDYGILHKAVANGHIDIVRLLLRAGASTVAVSPSYGDYKLKTPIDLAHEQGHANLVQMLERAQILELFEAARAGHVHHVKALLAAGASTQARLGDYGGTALHDAAQEGHTAVVKLLIDAGSPINAQGQAGDTPLHAAALKGQVEAARVLIGSGANVNATNNGGSTPLKTIMVLDLAEQNEHGSLVELLQAAGGRRGRLNTTPATNLVFPQPTTLNNMTPLPMHKVYSIVPVAVVLSLMSTPSALQASPPPERSAGALLQKSDQRSNGDPISPLLVIENSPSETGELYVSAQARNLGSRNRKALHVAAAAGDVEWVKRLISENPDRINEKDSHGLTPLHEAARKGHADVVEVLIAAGADPNDPTTHGNQTPLHLAAGMSSAEVCKVLLEAGAELWPTDEEATTAIGVAIQEGHVEIVRLLAEANVRRLSRPIVNLSNLSLPLLNGLHQAASGNNTEIMEIMLANRRDWIKQHNNLFGAGHWEEEDILDRGDNANNNTALHRAAHNGSTEIARLLVRAGADITVQNRDNKTPATLADEQGHGSLARMLGHFPKLHEAVAAGDPEDVKQLMAEEQSTNMKHPRDGYTPLHEAARQGRPEVVQVLIDAGADIYLKDKNNRTVLDIALEEGHIEIAKILINADGIIYDTKPLLQSAVSNGQIEMVKVLTEYLIEDARKLGRSLYQDINYNIDNHDYYATIDETTPGRSLLHVAATNGYTEIARILMQAGAYVMAKNNNNKTPVDLADEKGHGNLAQMLEQVPALRAAAVAGDAEKVRQLLAADAPTDAQDSHGATVLYRVIETYLEPAHLDPFGSTEEDGFRPLHPATEGHMEVVRLLIQAGAKVDSVTRWGNMHRSLTLSNSNPLHVAALAGQPEIVGLLIESGQDINGYLDFRNHRDAHNALSLALRNNPNEEVAELLIQAGVDVNAPHQVGSGFRDTPLHTVAAMGEEITMSVNIAKALINAGANLNAKLGQPNTLALGVGRTPLHQAASVNHIAMVKLLLENGASVNVKDDFDNSPLHLAIHEGHGKLAKLLIESGAYIHSRNDNGNLPVQVAAFAGLPDVITLLIDAGSPINAQDQAGDTPLHDAAAQGHVEAAQVLVGAGADVNATNNAGETPLDLAEQGGHGSVAEVLKAAGGQQGG